MNVPWNANLSPWDRPASLLIPTPHFEILTCLSLLFCYPRLVMSGKSPRGTSAASPTVAPAQVTTTFCVLGLQSAFTTFCVQGFGICSSGPPQFPFLISFFSVFTTVSADNNHRQLRGSENSQWAELPANADCSIIGKSEVDRWTKSQEASLLSTGLVLSCPQNLTAKPQGCDPQGGEAFAPGLLAARGYSKTLFSRARYLLF